MNSVRDKLSGEGAKSYKKNLVDVCVCETVCTNQGNTVWAWTPEREGEWKKAGTGRMPACSKMIVRGCRELHLEVVKCTDESQSSG